MCTCVCMCSLTVWSWAARLWDLWGTSCRYEKTKAAGVSFWIPAQGGVSRLDPLPSFWPGAKCTSWRGRAFLPSCLFSHCLNKLHPSGSSSSLLLVSCHPHTEQEEGSCHYRRRINRVIPLKQTLGVSDFVSSSAVRCPNAICHKLSPVHQNIAAALVEYCCLML